MMDPSQRYSVAVPWPSKRLKYCKGRDKGEERPAEAGKNVFN